MKEIICKQVDLWDGCDRMNFGFYIDESARDEDLKKAFPHCFISRKVFFIYDDLVDREEHSIVLLREQALAKLSETEKKALGL